MRIKLEDEVTKKAIVDVSVRPSLHALKCDSCGTVFKMEQFSSGDQFLGEVRGTFETGNVNVVDEDGKGRGNMFCAHVCSFKCAHEIFTGGWRRLDDAKPFVKFEKNGYPMVLARAELTITAMVSTEAQLRDRWGAIDRTEASKRRALEANSYGD